MNKNRLLLISIFTLSLTLRLILCLINDQANDNHYEVIEWTIKNHALPQDEICSECFQPKLYYIINLAIISVLKLSLRSEIITCMQMVNFILSFFILLYLWKFIQRQNVSEKIKLAAFALIAFNPCLLGINVQATNDTLEILFGILTIYYADVFFSKNKFIYIGILCAVLIGASIAKATGVILFIALLIIFIVKLFVGALSEKKIMFKSFVVLLFNYFLIVPYFGGYYQNYLKYNEPFHLILKKAPPDRKSVV